MPECKSSTRMGGHRSWPASSIHSPLIFMSHQFCVCAFCSLRLSCRRSNMRRWPNVGLLLAHRLTDILVWVMSPMNIAEYHWNRCSNEATIYIIYYHGALCTGCHNGILYHIRITWSMLEIYLFWTIRLLVVTDGAGLNWTIRNSLNIVIYL